jgi:hypothetical protein
MGCDERLATAIMCDGLPSGRVRRRGGSAAPILTMPLAGRMPLACRGLPGLASIVHTALPRRPVEDVSVRKARTYPHWFCAIMALPYSWSRILRACMMSAVMMALKSPFGIAAQRGAMESPFGIAAQTGGDEESVRHRCSKGGS